METKDDMHAIIHSPILRDIFICISLLTRLPVQLDERAYEHRSAAGWAFPLVGVVVGTASALIGILCMILGFGPNISAGCVVMASMIITGAMHADGLADCADGFWGGWTIERRLAIMKDSHIGAYGVIALILIIGLQWQIIAALMQAEIAFIALISAAVLSRAPLPLIMVRIPNARGAGLSHQTAMSDQNAAFGALVLGGIIALFMMGFSGLWVIGCAAAIAVAATALARWKIAGHTGDTLGATQMLGETFTLLAALKFLT
jgi:adenosylcobinamide-GDP ribazoletransferase